MALRGSARSALKHGSAHRLFVPAMLVLVFIMTAALLLYGGTRSTLQTTGISTTQLGTTRSTQLQAYVAKTLSRALKSDTLKARAEVLYKEAYDNIAISNAYASYARKVKLEMDKQVQIFMGEVAILRKLMSQSKKRSVDEGLMDEFEKDVKERLKILKTLTMENKESFESQMKIEKLIDTIFSVQDQLNRVKRQGAFANLVVAKSIPKSMYCLSTRLMEERITNGEKYDVEDTPAPELEDPQLYHYAIFSDNILAVSVVVNSLVKNAKAPKKHVFHIVTDKANLWTMKVWFKTRPLKEAHIEVRGMEEYDFLKPSYVPILRQIEAAKKRPLDDKTSPPNPRQRLSMLNHLRFYLPDIFPKLPKVLFLDDDVVVQRDLTELWSIDMEGKVNAAVETCFGSFHRFDTYVNFSHPLVKRKLDPAACAWAYGMNLFDLEAWKREKSTKKYHFWQNLNENRTLWKLGTLPAGLITFYKSTKPLDKSWHALGLGYNPNINPEKIKNAAVIHFNGHMKPWLDIGMKQYKDYWTKYLDYGMPYLQMCNFGL